MEEFDQPILEWPESVRGLTLPYIIRDGGGKRGGKKGKAVRQSNLIRGKTAKRCFLFHLGGKGKKPLLEGNHTLKLRYDGGGGNNRNLTSKRGVDLVYYNWVREEGEGRKFCFSLRQSARGKRGSSQAGNCEFIFYFAEGREKEEREPQKALDQNILIWRKGVKGFLPLAVARTLPDGRQGDLCLTVGEGRSYAIGSQKKKGGVGGEGEQKSAYWFLEIVSRHTEKDAANACVLKGYRHCSWGDVEARRLYSLGLRRKEGGGGGGWRIESFCFPPRGARGVFSELYFISFSREQERGEKGKGGRREIFANLSNSVLYKREKGRGGGN